MQCGSARLCERVAPGRKEGRREGGHPPGKHVPTCSSRVTSHRSSVFRELASSGDMPAISEGREKYRSQNTGTVDLVRRSLVIVCTVYL